jgi:hypothetical protein
MIELLGRLPIREVVAAQTIIPKLALVRILMARHTILRQPKVGPGQILHLDERALIGDHEIWRVTFLARKPGVLSLEFVAGLTVIKLLLGWLPMDEFEIFAVVLEVAVHALFAIWILELQLPVISVFCGEALSDLFVAV